MTDDKTAAAASAAEAATSANKAGAAATAAAASTTAAAAYETVVPAAPSKYHHNVDKYLARYAEHSARLQTWIGGYGAGLASLLVYQFRTALMDTKELWKSHHGADDAPVLIGKTTSMHSQLSCALMLIAVALGLQVIVLLMNKATQFSITHSDDDENNWDGWEKFSEKFSGSYWFDALCDIASVLLLAVATTEGIRALGLLP